MSNFMKILHISHTDIRSDSRILKEINSLYKNINGVKIIGIGVNDQSEFSNKNDFEFQIISIEVNKIKLNLPKVIVHIFNVFQITIKMFKIGKKIKPKIIHCHDTSVLPLGILLSKITNAKIIYDAHELESNRNGLNILSKKLTFIVEKLLWNFVNRLIVVSPSISTWYQKNLGEKSTEIILNSPIFNESNVNEDKSYLKNKFNIPCESKIFLYIGILGKGRGIDLIIEAFKKHDVSSHLIFLGYGELKCKLVDLSKKYHNIHVHDAVPHNEVVSIAKSADVGICFIQNVSLSDYYCLPNKLFEYAFAEIPVLASKFPDIEMIVEKYKLGKCCDLDPESIYNSIKEFEISKELPKINVNDLYDLSWSAQEEKLVKMYEKVIKCINEGGKI